MREISPQLEKVPPTGPRAAPSSAAGVGELDPARYRLCLFGNFGEIYPLWVKVGLALRELLGFLMRCRLGVSFPCLRPAVCLVPVCSWRFSPVPAILAGSFIRLRVAGGKNGPHEKSGGFAPPLFLCLFAVVCPAGKDLHAAIFDHINQAVCLVNPAGPQPGQIAL